ncbi:MAG: pyrroloquinoline quinone biosynthesis protein C [Gluconacetobacter liquefaciens]
MTDRPLSPDDLEAALRAIGAERYHNLHPFHRALHDGRLTKGQVQAWALNRYYYQCRIPAKDATLLARLPTADLRREWRRRLVDHDGAPPGPRRRAPGRARHPRGRRGPPTFVKHGRPPPPVGPPRPRPPRPRYGGGGVGYPAGDARGPGGGARWLKLTDGVGLDRTYVESLAGLLPATRFAVDAYVEFVRDRPILEAIASSLTELFSPTIISERVSGMLRHYDFVTPETLAYFQPRLTQAPRDSDFALAYVREHARTAAEQKAVLDALTFKCAVLWSMLDALDYAYVVPGRMPPGAFTPQAS